MSSPFNTYVHGQPGATVLAQQARARRADDARAQLNELVAPDLPIHDCDARRAACRPDRIWPT